MKRKNLTKILVADRGCDVLLTALSQDQDAELQYSRLASQALSMPPGHLSPQLQGLTQWSPSLSPALPKAWTRCLGGPAAEGCHQGMTCPFSRAPSPKDQEVEVWGREGGAPPQDGGTTSTTLYAFKVKVSPAQEANKEKSSLNGVRLVSLENSTTAGFM